ncbi:hypothetical protein ONR65_04565 [Proteus mirabilis]|uniref:hypothetical protein n=1 Tax=Proteus mirabilis TaxID=584 RepID=UPI00222FD648|nr:hypothetical protein [Proteus mirabilis]UZE79054.1 hypothetical protein ONR65_04565 [Proteus mirabilis]
MNINNLSITKNAQVFELKKELTKKSIEKYFNNIKKQGNFLIKKYVVITQQVQVKM